MSQYMWNKSKDECIKLMEFIFNEYGGPQYICLRKWLFYPVRLHHSSCGMKPELIKEYTQKRITNDFITPLIYNLSQGQDTTPGTREIIDKVYSEIRSHILSIKPCKLESIITITLQGYENRNMYILKKILFDLGQKHTYPKTVNKTKVWNSSHKHDKWFYTLINMVFASEFRLFLYSKGKYIIPDGINELLELIITFSDRQRFTPPSINNCLYLSCYFGSTHGMKWLFENYDRFIQYGLLPVSGFRKDNLELSLLKAIKRDNLEAVQVFLTRFPEYWSELDLLFRCCTIVVNDNIFQIRHDRQRYLNEKSLINDVCEYLMEKSYYVNKCLGLYIRQHAVDFDPNIKKIVIKHH